MATGFTTVSGSNIKDATGTVIAHATIYFRPVDNQGRTLSFRVGASGNGQILSEAVSATVTSGAFSIVLADTSLTSPVNVGYSVMVVDNLTGNNVLGAGYECVQPSGDTWNFDSYVPNSAPQAVIQTGAPGPPLLPRGAYASGTTYAIGDVVTSAGSSYISLVGSNTGHTPSSSPSQWMLLAAQGAAGTNGTNGLDGSLDGVAMASIGPYIAATEPAVRNLFDPTVSTAASGLFNSSGTLFGGNTGHSVTGYIPVAGLTSIISSAASNDQSSGLGYSFYDVNKAYISGGTVGASTAITVPPGAVWYRQQYIASLTNIMIVSGSTLPGTYVSFGYDDPTTAAAKVAAAIAPVSTVANAAPSAAQVLTYVHQGQPLVANLFDRVRVTSGFAIIASNGALSTDSDHSVTDYIPVVPGVAITSNTSAGLDQSPFFGFGWYDLNKTFISGGGFNAPATFTPPTGAAYFRQSLNSGNLNSCMIVTGSSVPSTYIAYGYNDPATEAANIAAAIAASKVSPNTFGVFGDSISALFNPRWQTPVAAKLGMTHVFNDPHAGRQTKDIFENYGGDGTGTYSGSPVGGAGWQIGMTTGHTLAQDLAGVNVLAIWLGTNDGGYFTGSTVGTPGDAPSRTGTFCAVISWVIGILQTANPAMRIVWITPYQFDPSNGHGGSSSVAGNTALVNAIVGTCALWGVPVINMQSGSGLNTNNWNPNLYDGLHPANIGFDHFVIPAIYRGLLGYN